MRPEEYFTNSWACFISLLSIQLACIPSGSMPCATSGSCTYASVNSHFGCSMNGKPLVLSQGMCALFSF